ncbi:SRPBCC family protein [Kutzneria viridogrisea]|uniref:Polyketide cyclase/dehydrase n=2 Tax=Kutzneria TaxID=43356 RepID=W5WBC9_9PSEU|nr:SRPBCC family protein [Kutzneria albida]AHH95529.1 hypothetical protein KALB_2160 [Kutzneria albida DSM 43870]MBA8927109.1 carbon monoxide dehydrogenase subunit G [Kutzneria viridogrisea]
MPNVTVSKELPVSKEQAWALLTDLSRYEEWLSLHQGWRSELPAELSQGAKVTEIIAIMGMANKIEWNFDSYEAPSTVRMSGTGMAGVKIAFTLSVQENGSGSAASIDADFSGQMVVGAIGTAIAKTARKELEQSLDTFAGLLG